MAPCTSANPTTCPSGGGGGGGLLGGLARGVATSAWDWICKSFADAAAQVLGAFAKAFVAIPPINVASDGVKSVYAISLGIAAVIAAILLIGQVIRTALTHDGSALAQGLIGVGKAALAFMLTLTIASTALRAADELTAFIVKQSFGSTKALTTKITTLVSWGANPGISSSLMLLLAVIAILVTIVLWFEMLLRNAAIAVLVATSPIAASGQISDATKSWWSKLVAATIQLITLKPVVALVFALGFSLTDKGGGLESVLAGMLVLVLAVVAWPAIGRFFTFASVHIGGAAGLGGMLGFAAGRNPGGGRTAPSGVAPDQFGQAAEERTMSAVATRTAATAAGVAAAMGPVVAAARVGQQAVNALAGRMEQTAGHAGMEGAHAHYAQPAGHPRYHSGAGGHPSRSAPPPPTHGAHPEVEPAGGLPVSQPAPEPRPEDGYR